jgi:alkaline phosphatase D
MLGAAQREWVLNGLDQSSARWNVLAQQVIFSPHDDAAGEARQFGTDRWDGYAAERSTILDFLARRKPSNPVVVTGDQHQNRVYDVVRDPDDPGPPLAAEFVGTSISSNGDSAPNTIYASPENPHLKLRDAHRGYVRCEVTPQRWRADFRVVSTVLQREATVSTLASFAVESGVPGVKQA